MKKLIAALIVGWLVWYGFFRHDPDWPDHPDPEGP